MYILISFNYMVRLYTCSY